MRVAADVLLKGFARHSLVIEVVFIDLAYGKQRIETVAAAGIFTAQKFVLPNRGAQDLAVVKLAAHFHQQFGDGNDAGIGFRRSG